MSVICILFCCGNTESINLPGKRIMKYFIKRNEEWMGIILVTHANLLTMKNKTISANSHMLCF